jgi:hypothetical protein
MVAFLLELHAALGSTSLQQRSLPRQIQNPVALLFTTRRRLGFAELFANGDVADVKQVPGKKVPTEATEEERRLLDFLRTPGPSVKAGSRKVSV